MGFKTQRQQQHPSHDRTDEQKLHDDESQRQQHSGRQDQVGKEPCLDEEHEFPSGPPGPGDSLFSVHAHLRDVKAKLRARFEPSSQ